MEPTGKRPTSFDWTDALMVFSVVVAASLFGIVITQVLYLLYYGTLVLKKMALDV